MLPAFSTGLGIPLSDSNPGRRTAKRPDWSQYSSMAEATTLRMEFSALSHATGARLPMPLLPHGAKRRQNLASQTVSSAVSACLRPAQASASTPTRRSAPRWPWSTSRRTRGSPRPSSTRTRAPGVTRSSPWGPGATPTTSTSSNRTSMRAGGTPGSSPRSRRAWPGSPTGSSAGPRARACSSSRSWTAGCPGRWTTSCASSRGSSRSPTRTASARRRGPSPPTTSSG